MNVNPYIYCIISIHPTSFFLFSFFPPSFPSFLPKEEKTTIVLGVKCCFSHRLKIEVKNWSHYLDLFSVEIPKLASWIHLQSPPWEDSLICWVCTKSFQSCLTLCNPMDYSPLGSSVHGDSPGKKECWVGCHALLQGIFPTQGLNPGFPHCRQILYHRNHQGSILVP